MAEPKLTYGKNQEGRLVHIETVPSGLACNCICPECGAQLIARKGEKRQNHFAHANGADCAGARMTALHMLAQQIIRDEKSIRTPGYNRYYKHPSKIISLESIILEQRFRTSEVNRRPDIVGIKHDKDGIKHELWIEIRVSHAIDKEKKHDIEKLGAICMEINLSALLGDNYTEESIRTALFEKDDNKEWINYPLLFRKNDTAKRKKEQEEKEAEQRRLDKLARERARLEEIINSWFKYGTKEKSEEIIRLIKNDPYNKQELPVTIYELLIPNNDFISWIKKSPRNLHGLELFYTVAKFYTKKISRSNIRDIDTVLKKYRYKESIDEFERILLEEFVSLRVIYQLRRTYERYIDYPVDYIKDWYKKYITKASFRNNCLKILSVEYGHIIGSNATNFIELADEICNTSLDLLPLFLMALDYRHQTKWPPNNIPSLDDKVIVKCREYVATHKADEGNEYSGLLNLAYGYIFKTKLYIPNTNEEMENQSEPSVVPEDVYRPLSDKEYFDLWEEFNKKWEKI